VTENLTKEDNDNNIKIDKIRLGGVGAVLFEKFLKNELSKLESKLKSKGFFFSDDATKNETIILYRVYSGMLDSIKFEGEGL